jgi:arsenate reductase
MRSNRKLIEKNSNLAKTKRVKPVEEIIMTITIYHNPRCSKSKQALSYLEKKGITPEIVLYLETPPTADEMRMILLKLDLPPRDIMRKNEKLYKELELGDPSLSEEALITAMCAHPSLIERPIVINGDQAKLARPADLIEEIL